MYKIRCAGIATGHKSHLSARNYYGHQNYDSCSTTVTVLLQLFLSCGGQPEAALDVFDREQLLSDIDAPSEAGSIECDSGVIQDYVRL